VNESVSNSGLAMIDMGDNRKVTDQGVDGHGMTSKLPLPKNKPGSIKERNYILVEAKKPQQGHLLRFC
jgi:hypothetical protein